VSETQVSAWIDKECPTPIQWQTTREYLVRRVQGLADDLEASNKRVAELEKDELQLIDERDSAENAIGDAYTLVTGNDCEWSNHFGYKEAIVEIESHSLAARVALAEVQCRVKELEAERAVLVGEIAANRNEVAVIRKMSNVNILDSVALMTHRAERMKAAIEVAAAREKTNSLKIEGL